MFSGKLSTKEREITMIFPAFIELLPPPGLYCSALSTVWKHGIKHLLLGGDFALACLLNYQRIPLMFILLLVNKCLKGKREEDDLT